VGSQDLKEKAYKALVRPTLEYAATIWDPNIQSQIDTIEMTQRRAARFVTRRYHNTSSVSNMLHQLQWPSLQQRRQNYKLTMLYKITRGMVAIDSDQYLTPRCQRTSRHFNSQAFIPFNGCANYYKQTFFPSIVPHWNSLSERTVTSATLQDFKTSLAAEMTP
jgi:hypothetical protein